MSSLCARNTKNVRAESDPVAALFPKRDNPITLLSAFLCGTILGVSSVCFLWSVLVMLGS